MTMENIPSYFQVFKEHPLMSKYPTTSAGTSTDYVVNQPNTSLLSLVLMMGTFFLAFFLRKLRNSRFLGGKVALKYCVFFVDIMRFLLHLVLVAHDCYCKSSGSQ